MGMTFIDSKFFSASYETTNAFFGLNFSINFFREIKLPSFTSPDFTSIAVSGSSVIISTSFL